MRKTVLVTGSAIGIGKSIIIEFAKRGYNTVIVYNNSKREADDLKKIVMDNYGITATVIKCDLTKENEIRKMIDDTISYFGSIDVIINNACYASDNYIDDKTKEEFMKVLEVNLVAPFLVIKHAYKHMKNGVIVNISSTDAEDSYNDISVDYSASKAGLNMLTKALSMAIYNNKLVAVMPNWVRTPAVEEMNQEYLQSELKRIGQRRLQEKEEVAIRVADIVEDDNTKNGDIIRIDGDVR